MITFEINTPEQFHERVTSIRDGHPLFRGVNESGYGLISRFGREILKMDAAKSADSKFDYVLRGKEQEMLGEFKNHAISYLTKIPQNDWEWMALAQHHGMPTRMLDWTSNPLVAAYFACHKSYKTDSAIYVIPDLRKYERRVLPESPIQIREDVLFFPPHISERINTQSAFLTVHPIPEKEFDNNEIEKWIIKKECIVEVNNVLRLYGINPQTMFPGLDGAAQKISERYCGALQT